MKNKINIFYIVTLLIIIFFPKITIINIPGTYVGIRIEDILVAFFVIGYIIKYLREKKINLKNEKLKKLLKYFILYIIVCLISTIRGIALNNVSMGISLLYLIRKVEYFIFLFMGYDYIKNNNDTKKILKIFDISIVVHSIIILLQSFGIIGGFLNGEYVATKGTRMFSTFNGPYEFSTFIVLLLPIYILKIIKEIKDRKQVLKYIIMIILILFGTVASQSRTSLAIFIILLVIIPIIEFRKQIVNFIKNNKNKTIIMFLILCIFISFGIKVILNM